MVNKGFNNGIGNSVRSTYDCCYGCTKRFAGDETRPNCHKTCKEYLTAKVKHEKAKCEANRKKYEENNALNATIDGQRRMKTRRKRIAKR